MFKITQNCQICNDVKKKCRVSTDSDLVLCMNTHESVPGWHYIGDTKNGLWGKFFPADEYSDKDKQQRLSEIADKRKKEQERRLKSFKEKALPESQRDRAIRTISELFGLSSRHKEDLLKRGLTEEQIKEGLFFSLSKGQNPGFGNELPITIPLNLPGVNEKRQIYSTTNGYACVCFNTKGEAIGWQVRDENPKADSKYKWAKGLHSSHLPCAELPITIAKKGKEQNTLHLTEGTLKPLIAANIHQLDVAGAASFNFLTSKSQFKLFIKDYEKIVIAPDGGVVKNATLMPIYQRLINWLKKEGKQVAIAWWGQVDKANLDFDEIEPNQFELIQVEAFIQLAMKHKGLKKKRNPMLPGEISKEEFDKKKGSKAKGFGEQLNKIQEICSKLKNAPKKAKKRLALITETRQVISFGNKAIPLPNENTRLKVTYKPGQRLEVLRWLMDLGYQSIADTSYMGSGKSFTLGELEPDIEQKIWYLDTNHMNVSTETVRDNFLDLKPRHSGLWLHDEKTLKRFPQNEEQEAEIRSNCTFSPLFPIIKVAGYEIEGTNNPICQTCPFKSKCSRQSGNGYGYKFLRRNSLLAKKIRAHINSLPPSSEHDYSKDIAIVEESSKAIAGTKTLKGTWRDILIQADRLASSAPVQYLKIQELVTKLRELLETDKYPQGKWGLDHESLIAILPNVELNEEDINLVEKALMPDFSTIIENSDASGNDVADSIFSEEAREKSVENLEKVQTNLLPNILKILSGKIQGSLGVNLKTFSVTIKDQSHANLLKSFSSVVFLDATPDLKTLQEISGRKNIVEIQEVLPNLANQTIVNVSLSGLGSRDVSETTNKKRAIFREWVRKEYPDAKFIGYKADKLDGWWGNHNRGTNQFKGVSCLVGEGLPNPNVGQVKHEYRAMFGDTQGFQEYYNHLVSAEVVQLLNRQRVQLYPHTNFITMLLQTNVDTDFIKKHYGISVVNRNAKDFNILCGTEKEITYYNLSEAIKAFKEEGLQRITQKDLAKEIGVTQGWISQIFKELKEVKPKLHKILLALMKGIYRDTNIFNEVDRLNKELLGYNPIKDTSEFIKTYAYYGLQASLDWLKWKPLAIQSWIIALITRQLDPINQEILIT